MLSPMRWNWPRWGLKIPWLFAYPGRGDRDVLQVKDRLEQERRVKMGKDFNRAFTKKLKDQQQSLFPYIMAGDHEKGLAGCSHRIFWKILSQPLKLAFLFRSGGEWPCDWKGRITQFAHGTTTGVWYPSDQNKCSFGHHDYFNPCSNMGSKASLEMKEQRSKIIPGSLLMSMRTW